MKKAIISLFLVFQFLFLLANTQSLFAELNKNSCYVIVIDDYWVMKSSSLNIGNKGSSSCGSDKSVPNEDNLREKNRIIEALKEEIINYTAKNTDCVLFFLRSEIFCCRKELDITKQFKKNKTEEISWLDKNLFLKNENKCVFATVDENKIFKELNETVKRNENHNSEAIKSKMLRDICWYAFNIKKCHLLLKGFSAQNINEYKVYDITDDYIIYFKQKTGKNYEQSLLFSEK